MLKKMIEKYVDWPMTAEEAESKVIEYNCAEAMLNAANDYYHLGLDSKAFKAIAPFGGGFYLEKTCGFVTGGLAAIGVLYATDDKPYANPQLIEMGQKWVQAFSDKFGDSECSIVKQGRICKYFAVEAAELFESLVGSPQ